MGHGGIKMFGAISSAIGRVFGTDKAAESLIDNTANALDKLWYTKEEKAEDRAKSATEARGMVIEWMKATSGQNLARRLIALTVTIVWTTQYVTMMCLSVIGVWLENPDKTIESAKVIGEYAQNMNGAMMLILAFYFAAPHMGSLAQSALNKFGSDK